MDEQQQSLHNFETEMKLLKKDIQQMDKLCIKIAESIEKIQEVNVSLMKMIALHDEKLEQRQKIEDQIRGEMREINFRITTINSEFFEKLELMERHINSKIDSAIANVPCMKMQHNNSADTEKKSVPEVNRYMWMLMGAALSLGWLFGNVNLSTLGTLFK